MVVFLAHVEHRDDVRVRQDAGALGLAKEPDAVLVVRQQM